MIEIEGKRIENPFLWIPPHERPLSEWHFGPPILPEKPETRKPAFYINSRIEDSEDAVYFVNNTSEILDFVKSSSDGFETEDDEVITIKGPEYYYKDVKPNEAVQLESYDRFDSDSVLSLVIEVSSKSLGLQTFNMCNKGGPRKGILLWNNGDL
jgi:hypothetical protein